MPATPFSSWFERTVVLMLLVMLVFVIWIGSSLRDHVNVLKIDIRALRGLLSSIQTPVQCPEPGVQTTKICHYKLHIEPLLNSDGQIRTGWFLATVPKEVVQQAYTECVNTKPKHQVMENHICVDSTSYNYREYAIQVDGNVAPGTYEFINDPATNHLMRPPVPKK